MQVRNLFALVAPYDANILTCKSAMSLNFSLIAYWMHELAKSAKS